MERVKSNLTYLKKYSISIICLIFAVSLVLYSKTNLEAARQGLKLWANSVVPSLFPFFVATELLCCTNLVNLARKVFEKANSKIIRSSRRRSNCFYYGDNKWISYWSKNCSKF